jgi:hypothetical protein
MFACSFLSCLWMLCDALMLGVFDSTIYFSVLVLFLMMIKKSEMMFHVLKTTAYTNCKTHSWKGLIIRFFLSLLVVTILGSRNQKKYSKFLNLTSLGYLPYKFQLKNVEPWVLFSKFHRRTNLMAFLVTILGSRNQENTQNFEIWHPKSTSHLNST